MMDHKHFSEEMVGRVLLVLFCVISAGQRWWLPIVIAPVFWQFWDITAGRRSRIYQPALKLIADGITWLVWLGYIGYSTVSFGLSVGHWYGWLLGVLVALIVAQLVGLLWPRRWHLEAMDGRL